MPAVLEGIAQHGSLESITFYAGKSPDVILLQISAHCYFAPSAHKQTASAERHEIVHATRDLQVEGWATAVGGIIKINLLAGREEDKTLVFDQAVERQGAYLETPVPNAGAMVGEEPFVAVTIESGIVQMAIVERQGDGIDLNVRADFLHPQQSARRILHPCHTISDDVDEAHRIARTRERIEETIVTCVEIIASPTVGLHPDVARIGEVKVQNALVLDAHRVARIGLECLGLSAIEAHQPVPRTQPDEAVSVLHELRDLRLRYLVENGILLHLERTLSTERHRSSSDEDDDEQQDGHHPPMHAVGAHFFFSARRFFT